MLNQNDLAFLAKRRRLARYWNVVGLAMLAAVAGLALWLYFDIPNLINPIHVADQLTTGAIEPATLQLMAVLLPVVVGGTLGLIAIIVLFGFAVFAQERRYHRIISNLMGRDADTGHDPAESNTDHRT